MKMKTELKHRARLARWRWITNGQGSLSYRLTPSGKPAKVDALKQLRSDGIYVGDAINGLGLSHVDELEDEANRIIALPRNQTSIEAHHEAIAKGADGYKDFLVGLLDPTHNFEINNPFIRFCTQPTLLRLVNS